jgi:GAF domain-containing protein
VPYVRCASCGLTAYVTRTRWLSNACPHCEAPLPSVSLTPSAEADSSGDEAVARALALAREQLAVDVALLSEVRDGREIVHAVAGDWPGVDSLEGAALALDDTICKRLLDGRVTNVVGDVASDERVNSLPMTREFGLGAWIGVPLELSDARLYMLCRLVREARPELGEDDLRFLRGVGESMRSTLERPAAQA